jgi:hypothetical protein
MGIISGVKGETLWMTFSQYYRVPLMGYTRSIRSNGSSSGTALPNAF